MTERDSYAPGTPSWVDLGSPDPDASATFYGGLFGWRVEDAGPDAGGYRMCTMRGRSVAGIGPAQDGGGPPRWTVYVTVEDADATAKAVEQAGGTVLSAPFDVLTAGRMAVFADPAGVPFSVWQAGDHAGAGITGEPGTLTWVELMARDLAPEREFYGSVFGWRAEPEELGDGLEHYHWTLGGEAAEDAGGDTGGETGGSAVQMAGELFPPEVPDQWMVCFEVADCDASAAKVVELGGRVDVPPLDAPSFGRFAVCAGPHGEPFAIARTVSATSGETVGGRA